MEHALAKQGAIPSGTAGAHTTQYLTFSIAGEEYGVPILRVLEILAFDTLTRIPAAPPCIRGVINLRGRVVPIVDLAIKFGEPECAITKRTCTVVVEVVMEGELTSIGLMVESVKESLELRAEDIEPAPPFGTRALSKFLLGMGKLDKKFILLLNLDYVLSVTELTRAVEAGKTDAARGDAEPAPDSGPRTAEDHTAALLDEAGSGIAIE
jgi:purine-binding chemotaxis protein CheW